MTALALDVRELSFDEIDFVTGGQKSGQGSGHKTGPAAPAQSDGEKLVEHATMTGYLALATGAAGAVVAGVTLVVSVLFFATPAH